MYSLPVSGSTPTRYAAQLRKRLSYVYDRVHAFSKRQQDLQKDTYNQRVRSEPYAIGDGVMLREPAVPKDTSVKFIDIGKAL